MLEKSNMNMFQSTFFAFHRKKLIMGKKYFWVNCPFRKHWKKNHTGLIYMSDIVFADLKLYSCGVWWNIRTCLENLFFLSICSKFFQFTFGTNYGTTTLASLYTSYSMSSLLQRHRQLFKMSVNRVCLGSLCFWSVNNTGVFFPHSSAVDQSRRRSAPWWMISASEAALWLACWWLQWP